MNKLGMHIHGVKPGVIEAVALLKPRTITIMDPKPEEIRNIRNVSPDTFVVMRKYEDGRGWRDTDPFWWAEQCYAQSGGLADGVVGWNEPFGHDSRHLCAPFDEWSYVFLSACKQLGTMEAVVLCMATGNWTGAGDRYKINEDFPLTCSAAKYFGPHEYSWPNLQAGAGWYALRFKAWIEDIGRGDVRFIITEAGLTQGIIAGRGDIGWRSGGPEGVTEDSYIATLDWYNAELCTVPQCLGCCLYDYAGQWFGWPTFEQLGLENRIYQIQAPEIPEPPEPPNGGEIMIPDNVKIYDFNNNPFDPNATTRDKAWLQSIFGPGIRVLPIEEKADVELKPGDIIYKIEWLDCKVGETSVVIHVEGTDGKAQQGKLPVFGWSKAEPHGLTETWKLWTKNGVFGPTNVNGDVGPSMGTGAYYDWTKIDPETGEYERGPHFVWVWDKPSDYIDGIGMLTWHPDVEGNHLHVNIGYQAVAYQGEEEPPPADGELLDVVKEIRDAVLRIEEKMGKESPPAPPPPTDTAFRGEYYNNISLAGAPVVRDDEEINFDWGTNGPGVAGIPADKFSVCWTAKRTFEAGTYKFTMRVDDGGRLWVDGNKLIDSWKEQSATSYYATVTLTEGQHELRMDYFESTGLAVAQLSWAKQ